MRDDLNKVDKGRAQGGGRVLHDSLGVRRRARGQRAAAAARALRRLRRAHLLQLPREQR